jgi:uncharacterized delta-60 repeat protein
VDAGANIAVYSILPQTDGTILISGAFTQYNGEARGGVARLTSSGALDATFAVGAGANGTVERLVQHGSLIYACGTFTTYDGVSRGRVAPLTAAGGLDTTFLDTGAGANGSVDSLAVQEDGKVLIGGWFSTWNGTGHAYLARLTDTGVLDTFPAWGGGPDGSVTWIGFQSDGKVVISGSFVHYNSIFRQAVARLWN